MLSHRGSPASLVPLISRMFPAIKNIHFTEVASSESYGHEADEGKREIWLPDEYCSQAHNVATIVHYWDVSSCLTHKTTNVQHIRQIFCASHTVFTFPYGLCAKASR